MKASWWYSRRTGNEAFNKAHRGGRTTADKAIRRLSRGVRRPSRAWPKGILQELADGLAQTLTYRTGGFYLVEPKLLISFGHDVESPLPKTGFKDRSYPTSCVQLRLQPNSARLFPWKKSWSTDTPSEMNAIGRGHALPGHEQTAVPGQQTRLRGSAGSPGSAAALGVSQNWPWPASPVQGGPKRSV